MGNGMRVRGVVGAYQSNFTAQAVSQVIPKQVNNIHSGVHDVGVLVRITPATILKLSPMAKVLLKQAPLMES
jgi:hypothetical protein